MQGSRLVEGRDRAGTGPAFEILDSGGEQEPIPGASDPTQPQPPEAQISLEMGECHLDLGRSRAERTNTTVPLSARTCSRSASNRLPLAQRGFRAQARQSLGLVQ